MRPAGVLRVILLTTLALQLFHTAALAAEVTDPVNSLGWKEVDDHIVITFSLRDGGPYRVRMRGSRDGGRTWTMTPASGSLSGDVGDRVPSGQDRRIVWDVLGQYPEGLLLESFAVEVTAEPVERKPKPPSGNPASKEGWYIGMGRSDLKVESNLPGLRSVDVDNASQVQGGYRFGPTTSFDAVYVYRDMEDQGGEEMELSLFVTGLQYFLGDRGRGGFWLGLYYVTSTFEWTSQTAPFMEYKTSGISWGGGVDVPLGRVRISYSFRQHGLGGGELILWDGSHLMQEVECDIGETALVLLYDF